jgi:hypothetical protein
MQHNTPRSENESDFKQSQKDKFYIYRIRHPGKAKSIRAAQHAPAFINETPLVQNYEVVAQFLLVDARQTPEFCRGKLGGIVEFVS